VAFVILPLAVTLLVGLANTGATFPVGIVDRSPTAATKRLQRSVDRQPGIDVHRFSSTAALAQATAERGVAAGVVVTPSRASPEGASVALRPGPDDDATAAVRDAVTAAACTGCASRGRVERLGRPPRSTGFGPTSNLVLFVFATSLAAAGGLAETRSSGLSRRVAAAPVTRRAIVVGTLGGRLLISLYQAVTVLVFGSVLFGVQWGSPLYVAAVVTAFSVVSASAAVVLGTVVRTTEQAIAVGIPVSILFGLLGGCFYSLRATSATLRMVGHVMPHAWAMDALGAARGGPAGSVLGPLAVLAGMAALLLAVAGARVRTAVAQ
jgi:ABC-2 type transport system permease protein